MTIAVGIIGPTFLILGADSQEGWSPELTKAKRKFRVLGLNVGRRGKITRGRLAIAGAGGSDFVAYLQTRIGESVQNLKVSEDEFITSAEITIEAELRDFYEKHWALLAHLPQHQQSEPWLLVAAQFGDKRALWVTAASTVRRIDGGYAAIGAGRVWAEAALDAGYTFYTREHAATVAASYAIYIAKENTENCGRDTNLISLRGEPSELMAVAKQSAIEEAESVFSRYEEFKGDPFNFLVAPEKMNIAHASDFVLTKMRDELSVIDFYAL